MTTLQAALHSGNATQMDKQQARVSMCLQVDLISKGDPLLSVPMLRGVLLWQASLSREPLADTLLRLVNDCCEWLLGHFERFITDRVRPAGGTTLAA